MTYKNNFLINHAIILPLKENYNKKESGAVSIWVNKYLKHSKFKNNITVFCSKHSKTYLYGKKIIPIKTNSGIFSNYLYIRKIFEIIKKKKIYSVEIHNRPEYANYLLKNSNLRINLYFHNDPRSLRGSKQKSQRELLLNKCNKIILVSEYLKKQYFKDIDYKHNNNVEIIYNSINKIKKFPLKEKIIIFSGKLNEAKGYKIFCNTIYKILEKYKDWRALIIGNEPRENIKIKHKRIKLLNWIEHDKLLKFYERSSISVVNPKWQEPFGRTALESASRGCAVITSYSGGLQETFNNNLLLKSNNEKNLYNKINQLIKSKKKLIQIQKKNFNNVLHDISFQTKKIDTSIPIKKIYYVNKKNLRILHISTFGDKLNHRTFNISISKKLSSGFIRNGHDVIDIESRNNNKKFLDNLYIDKKILDVCTNYKPNLIILGHNNCLTSDTIEKIKKIYNCKFSLWFEDHLVKGDPSYSRNINLIEKNKDLIDNYFFTTHPSAISTKINKNKIFFMPIPVDKNIEFEHLYNYPKSKDMFFALSHGVNYGRLKKNTLDERQLFLDKLIDINKNKILFNFFGVYNEEPKWNFDFLDELKISKTALNLSRGGPSKYSTSNRFATLMGNGMVTLISSKISYQDFFSENELLIYNNIEDLYEKLCNVISDPIRLYKIGKNAKRKYFNIFSNNIISNYIIEKNFNIKTNSSFIWDKH